MQKLAGTQGRERHDPTPSPDSPERERPKRRLSLASAIAAIGAIVLAGPWFGNWWGQQPADAVSHYNRGVDLLAQRKLVAAVAEYRAAIRIKPEYAEAHNGLGAALSEQGKHEEAIAEFHTAIRLRPDLAAAHQNLGVALDTQGKSPEALAAFREAMRLNPDDGATHNSLALVLAAFPGRPPSDFDEALVHARRAVALGPEKGNRYGSLALADYRAGHWTESLAAGERAMALHNGGDAYDWFLQALAHWQKGDKHEARKWFDKAVAWSKENAPKDAKVRQLRTEAAALLGQPGPGASRQNPPASPAAEKPR